MERAAYASASAVSLADKVNYECRSGRNKKNKSEKASLCEILSAYNLLVHEYRKSFVHSAYHKRHTVIGYNHGEYRENYAYHRFFQIRSGYRSKTSRFGNSENSRRIIGCTVFVLENIGYHDVGDGKSIHDRADDNSPEAVNSLGHAEKLCQASVGSEKNDKSHSVRNRGNQHRKQNAKVKKGFKTYRCSCHAPRSTRGNDDCNQRSRYGYRKGVSRCFKYAFVGEKRTEIGFSEIGEHGEKRAENRNNEETAEKKYRSSAEHIFPCYRYFCCQQKPPRYLIYFARESIFTFRLSRTKLRT